MMNFLSWILMGIGVGNVILVCVIIFWERKKPISALAWIVTITFMPVLGFLLYILFGSQEHLYKGPRLFKTKKQLDDEYLKKSMGKISYNKDDIASSPGMAKYQDIITLHTKSSGSGYTSDNDINIYIDAGHKYSALLKDISNARRHIHLMYYRINDDTISNKLIDALVEKCSQGVEVRLVCDIFGSFYTLPKTFERLKAAGGEIHRFSPYKLFRNYNINYRNHRKIAVIDGRIGYLGGMNIGDEYIRGKKNLKPWRDTHIRITGSAVHFLQIRFLMDWEYVRSIAVNSPPHLNPEYFFPTPIKNGSTGIQIVSSGSDTGDFIKTGYIKMINMAKKSLYLQTPYFVPDDPFLEAIKIAAMSGIDIKVMLPSVPDKLFVYRATTSYIRDLLDYGVDVYLYNGFLHAKMLVTDEAVVSIGSANADARSFYLNFETNAFIYDADFGRRCADIFRDDLKNSERVTDEVYSMRSPMVKLQEAVCRLMSPLL